MSINDSDLILLKSSEEQLPSQEGKRGRPRVNGRVTISISNLGKSSYDLMKVIQKLTGDFFNLKISNLILYGAETNATQVTFVVPGVDKDTRIRFSLVSKSDSKTILQTPSVVEKKIAVSPPPVPTLAPTASTISLKTVVTPIDASDKADNSNPPALEEEFPAFAKALAEIRRIIAEDSENEDDGMNKEPQQAFTADEMSALGTTRWLNQN